MSEDRRGEFRVFGPPGTGKTTWMSKQISVAAEKFGVNNVVVASFTKAAAKEVAGRELPIPEEAIGTLHALCYRALGKPKIAEAFLKEFGEAAGMLFTGASIAPGMDEGADRPAGTTQDDEDYMELSRLRNLMVSREAWPDRIRAFEKVWSGWKQEHDMMDFTDLIEIASKDMLYAPGNAQVGFFDECLAGDTIVMLEGVGPVPIGDVVESQTGGRVLSWDGNAACWRKITGWHKSKVRGRRIVSIGGVLATEDHEVFVAGEGFVPCIELCFHEKECVVLSGYEKIQQPEIVDRGPVRSRARKCSRGLAHFCGERGEHQCSAGYDERIRPVGIPALESGGAQRVGSICDRSTADELGRVDIPGRDENTPRVHKSHGRGQKPRGHYEENEPNGSCGPVHGRREYPEEQACGSHLDALTRFRGDRRHLGVDGQEWGAERHQHICKGDSNQAAQGWRELPCEAGRASCSSVHGIENARDTTGKKGPESCAYFDCPSCSLPCLWAGASRKKISAVLREERMQEGNGTQGDCEIQGDENVFCIGVEGTECFFAGGVLVHNCQDSTPLQHALMRRWGKSMEFFILAGDDDQCLYSFLGARHSTLVGDGFPEERKLFLRQSWRVPRAVQAYAQRVIEKVAVRQAKDYRPRDEEGEVCVNNGVTFKRPERLIPEIEEDLAKGHTVMVLAPCSYALNPTVKALKAQGIGICNPYRPSRGDWNPLAISKKKESALSRVLDFLNPAMVLAFEGEEKGSLIWSPKQVLAWMKVIDHKSLFARGAAAHFKRMAEEERVGAAEMLEALWQYSTQPGVISGLITALSKGDKDTARRFLRTSFNPSSKICAENADYALRCVERAGSEEEAARPKVCVGTIHSVKGGQADSIYIIPDVPQNVYLETLHSREAYDSSIRLAYVALTRAKRKVSIFRPDTRFTLRGIYS